MTDDVQRAIGRLEGRVDAVLGQVAELRQDLQDVKRIVGAARAEAVAARAETSGTASRLTNLEQLLRQDDRDRHDSRDWHRQLVLGCLALLGMFGSSTAAILIERLLV